MEDAVNIVRHPTAASATRKDPPSSDAPAVTEATTKAPDRRAAFARRKHRASDRSSSRNQSFSLKTPHVDTGSSRQYKLYGRSDEEEALLDAYERAVGTMYAPKTDNIQHMVWISGEPGSGKTSLAQTLRRRVVKGDGGFFVSGKFQANVYEPYSAFVAALTEYTDVLLETKPHKAKAIQSALRGAISGEDEVLLRATIPALDRILSGGRSLHVPVHHALRKSNKGYPTQQHTSTTSPDAMHRFHRCFCKCMQALLTEGPMVLFLDDLQWADTASLELLKALCWNGSEGPLLLVGAHRTLLPHDTRPFASTLAQPDTEWPEDRVRITRISLENLDQAQVNDLISDLLYLPISETEPLARVVLQRTEGNPFYVLHLLKFLAEEEWLYQQDETWMWDFDQIQRNMDTKDTVIEFMAKKIQKALVDDELSVLKVTSCLGKEIDDSALALIMGSPSLTSRALESAERAGFLVFVPHAGGYRFVHDHIQDAAFSLIPDEARAGFLWDIGRKLWKKSTSQALEANIFVVVNLLHAGKDVAVKTSDKYAVAELHLLAGEKAVSLSAFSDASRYHSRGIEWLPEDSWTANYELTLNLYTAAAEVAVSNSNFEQVRTLIEDVFAHAKCLGDKFRCYVTLIASMGQQGNVKQAATLAFEVLRELGEPFPREPTKVAIIADLIRTKWALRGRRDSDLLNIRTMKDPRKLAAARISTLVFRYLMLARSPFASLVAFRIIRLCLAYGQFSGASVGFSVYAMILCKMGDIEGSLRFGKLSISMLERESQIRAWQPHVFVAFYGFIAFYESPLREVLDYVKSASDIALKSGNREVSSLCAYVHCTNLYSSGVPLPILDQALTSYTQAMSRFKQENALLLMLPMQQFVRNVQGGTRTPSILSGDSFDQEQSLKEATKHGMEGVVSIAAYLSADVAYLFRDFEQADKVCREFRDLKKDPPTAFVYARFMVVECLAEIASMRQSTHDNNNWSRKTVSRVRKFMKQLTKWAKMAPSNFAFRYALLQAEFASVDCTSTLSATGCMKLYEEAIKGAEQEGFIQEAAIACERAGDHLERMGDMAAAATFYGQAHDLYLEWGAPAKAAQIKEELMES